MVLEPGDDPVPQHCVANLDSIESVSIAVLTDRLGTLTAGRTNEVCSALAVATDCG